MKPKTDYSAWSKENLISTIDTLQDCYNSMIEQNHRLLDSLKQWERMFENEKIINELLKSDELTSGFTETVVKEITIKDLERIAFNPKTPDKEAKKALRQLLKLNKKTN